MGSPFGGGKREGALLKLAEELGYDLCETELSFPIGAEKKDDVIDDVVLFQAIPREEKRGILVFKKVNEQGRVYFFSTPCIVKEGKKLEFFTYLRRKKESDEGQKQQQGLGSRILRAAKSAMEKQKDLEKAYPQTSAYSKFIFKTAVGFPSYLVADMPAICDCVAGLCKTLSLPKKQIYGKLGRKAFNMCMWAAACAAGNFINGKVISSVFRMAVKANWYEGLPGKMAETVLDKEILNSSEEREGKTKVGKEDKKVEEEADEILMDVMVEEEHFEQYLFTLCDENEEKKNDEDFAEYFSALWECVEEEESGAKNCETDINKEKEPEL